MIIKEENFKWHLEAFASELFILCSCNLRSDELFRLYILPFCFSSKCTWQCL